VCSVVVRVEADGGGEAGGPVQEEKARQGGPVQNISDDGGTHMRLSLCQQFSASEDTDSISLGVNNSCPWSYSMALQCRP
jgi:hypothetical protein